MVIRFLQTTPSENPDFPFQAGQIISVTAPTRFLLSLIDGIHAEVVRTDDIERAIEEPVAVPEPVRRRVRVKH